MPASTETNPVAGEEKLRDPAPSIGQIARIMRSPFLDDGVDETPAHALAMQLAFAIQYFKHRDMTPILYDMEKRTCRAITIHPSIARLTGQRDPEGAIRFAHYFGLTVDRLKTNLRYAICYFRPVVWEWTLSWCAEHGKRPGSVIHRAIWLQIARSRGEFRLDASAHPDYKYIVERNQRRCRPITFRVILRAMPANKCVLCDAPARYTCRGVSCFTQYCSTTCQKMHWDRHKTECHNEMRQKTVYANEAPFRDFLAGDDRGDEWCRMLLSGSLPSWE